MALADTEYIGEGGHGGPTTHSGYVGKPAPFAYQGESNIFAMHKHDYVTEDIAAARYGAWLNHIDQATQVPPPMVSRAIPVRFLPWSGHGSGVLTVPAGNTLRVQPAPWQFNAPVNVINQVTGTQAIGDQVAEALLDIISRETFDGRVGTIAYQNITMADSGFNTLGGNVGDRQYFPTAQFMGAAMTFEVLVPQGSTAEVVCIGQNEVRGIGFGEVLSGSKVEPWFHGNQSLEAKLLYPDHTEANNDFFIEAAAETLGNLNQFKPSQLLVGNDDTRSMSWFMPIVPAVGGQFMLMKQTTGSNAERASQFLVVPSNIIDTDILLGGRGTAQRHPYQSGVTTPGVGDVTLGNNRILQVAAGATTDNTAVTIFHEMTKRYARAVQNMSQCMRAGMPVFECTATGGPVSINVHFKFFYQIATTTTHPSYEQAAAGHPISETTLEEYKRWAATHSGQGRTVAEAITESKRATHVNRPPHPKIQSMNIPQLENHGMSMVLPKPGIHAPVNHEGPGTMQKLLGGVGSKLWSGITKGVGWLWAHKSEIGQAAETVGGMVGRVRPGIGAALTIGGEALEALPAGGGRRRARVDVANEGMRQIQYAPTPRCGYSFIEEA